MKNNSERQKAFIENLKATMWENNKAVWLTSSPIILGFLLIFLITPTPGKELRTLALPSFLWGWTGVIIMVRKEVPSIFMPQRGKWAVAQGAFITLLCWGAALVALFGS